MASLQAAKEDGYKIVGAIATHYHFDHTGVASSGQCAMVVQRRDPPRHRRGPAVNKKSDLTGGKPPPPYDKYPVTVDGMHTVAKKIANSKVYVGPGDYKILHEGMGILRMLPCEGSAYHVV